MTVALQGISGRGAKRDLNPPGGKPRSQHLTAVGASRLAASVGGRRRLANRPVPTGGTALLRPDDADRKLFRACHSRARSPRVQDPELFRHPASRDQSRAWRLILSMRCWFHQITLAARYRSASAACGVRSELGDNAQSRKRTYCERRTNRVHCFHAGRSLSGPRIRSYKEWEQ